LFASAKVTSLFKIERKAVRVLPDPVGLDIRMFCLFLIAGTPYF